MISIFNFSDSTFIFNFNQKFNFSFEFSRKNHKDDLEWLCNDRIEYFKMVAELHRMEQKLPLDVRYAPKEKHHFEGLKF